MCGIAGLILKNGASTGIADNIRRMTQLIQHRGPDGEGVYCYQNLGLGHRRLAIIDVSPDGHQPMFYSNDQLVITYNGEIYNYIEIKQELEGLGYTFFSRTDTEVILAAYAEWGQECVHRFNGMWAFAILDKLKNSVFCSRDRFGVKPFYYVNTPELFAFGSEIKQLVPFLKSVSANQELLIDFLLTSITDQSDNTFFTNVVKLPASHNLVYNLDNNNLSIKSFYQLSFNQKYADMSQVEAIDTYMNLLENAIKLRLRADVPVGTCLSGGLDSSSVASIAAPLYQSAAGRSFNGITAVSEQESNNEAEYARQIIEFSKMQWLQVKPSYANFLDSLPHIVDSQEEPFGSPSLTMQYFVMKCAHDNGIKVLLDGQGGDETLLGYEKYYGSYLATTLRQHGFIAFKQALKSSKMNNSKLSLFNSMKYLLGGTIVPLRYLFYKNRHSYLLQRPHCPSHLSAYARSIWNTFQLQRLEIESTNLPVLLRYEDKNSMAHSIETRLPFLDYRLVEAALSLPGHFKIKEGWSKWLLRKGMENRMPDSIVWRKNKFGFEAPEALWLQKHFNEMHEVVQSSIIFKEIANTQELKKNYARLDARSQWRLYSIALWEKAFGVSG